MLAFAATAHAGAMQDGEELFEKQFAAISNRDGVVVRSGASANDMPVMSLDKDEEAIMVGFDRSRKFLKILPPAGSYCLVPKARVNISGDIATAPSPEQPRLGTVSMQLTVRVGSKLSSTPGSTSTVLAPNTEVEVIGEESIYFKISPPKGVFFYVLRADLSKGREVKVTETPDAYVVAEIPQEEAIEAAGGEEIENAGAIASNDTGDEAGTEVDTGAADGTATGETAEEMASGNTVVADAGQAEGQSTGEMTGEMTGEAVAQQTEEEAAEPAVPVGPTLATRFADIDSQYVSVAEQPLAEQPLDELHASYSELLAEAQASSDAAASAMVPVLNARIATIEVRRQALADLREVQQLERQMADRQKALVAEQQEMEERVERGRIEVFTAVGQLRPSTLQLGGNKGMLFRLVDPVSQRTVIYLRAKDKEAAELMPRLEQFVGVQGQAFRDNEYEMRYIQVTGSKVVDPEQVYNHVAAQIIPPSMIDPTRAAVASGEVAAGETGAIEASDQQ